MRPKVNVIVRLEFELIYFGAAVLQFSHYRIRLGVIQVIDGVSFYFILLNTLTLHIRAERYFLTIFLNLKKSGGRSYMPSNPIYMCVCVCVCVC